MPGFEVERSGKLVRRWRWTADAEESDDEPGTGLALSRRSARRAAQGYPPRAVFTSALLIVLGLLMLYLAHEAQASPWMYVFAAAYILVGVFLAVKPGRPRVGAARRRKS
ncbi:hypothetical protein [uncultured Jatrophihabitans sp.]|uniref:hypothetical protein n=1 Tax=uncultured Jatrophihabitans sp. TaxID=1610747 RepID=UPI0035CABE71